MKILLLLLLIQIAFVLSQTAKSTFFQTFSENVTLILKANEASLLRPAFNYDDKVNKWLFGTSNGTVIAVYKNERLLERMLFECEPNENDCKSLKIPKIDYTYVGEYKREADIDNSKSTDTYYYLSVYETPFIISCLDTLNCRFNYTNNKLSLRSNEPIQFSVSTNIWQNNGTETKAEFSFNDPNCDMYDTKRKLIKSDQTKLEQIELKKECTRKFNQDDLKYQFVLKYKNDINDNKQIDTLNIDLDVHYGPERLTSSELNIVIEQGEQRSLKCPFLGNPIDYYWKSLSIKDNTEYSGSQILILSKSLTPGNYQYQCRAYLGGFIQRQTESVTFNVRVNAAPTIAPNRKNNLGGIIGGAVGGTIGLLVIIILIILFIRYKRRVPKDEVDKAKELDMNDNSTSSSHIKNINRFNHHNHEKLNGILNDNYSNGSNDNRLTGILATHQPNASSYAALAHAAAAAVAQQQNSVYQSNTARLKAASFNNPGFYESNNFANLNPGESPPSYDTALQQTTDQQSPRLLPKQYQKSQTLLNKDFTGSNSKIHTQYEPTNSYINNGQLYNQSPMLNSHQQQVQYTDVMTLNNKARTRGPIPIDQQPQTPTQYTSVSQYTLPPASHV